MLRIAYKFNLQKFKTQIFNPLLYSTSSSTDEIIQPFTNYLVNSLNFTPQQALSISKKVKEFKFSACNSNSVVEFLKQHGFDDTRIKKVVSVNPNILSSRVDETLKPKFKFLHDLGISGSNLIRVTLINQSVVSNVALLENDYGIDIKIIRKFLIMNPRFLHRKPEFFKLVVNRVVKELKINPDSGMFLYGIRLLTSSSDETIESKRQSFKSFGWSNYHVSELMRRCPISFELSEENIRNKLDFFTKTMGYKPEYLISRYVLFNYSLEKRMLPRYRVLQDLKERGLLRIDYDFNSAVKKSERDFLELLIKPYKDDVPNLLELYQNSKGCSDGDSLSR